MIRRNYRRFGRWSNTNAKTKTLNFASPEECRIFAYYLYTICNYKIEFYPDNEDEGDYLSYVYGFFMKLVKRLGKERAVESYLEKLIKHYAEKKILTPFNSQSESDRVHLFESSNIPYQFEEDSTVDRNISCEVSNLTLAEVDLYRVFHVTRSNNIFLAVIANFLIRKTPEESPCLLTKIPSYLKKSLMDFSKFDFAKKALNLSETELALLDCYYRCFSNMTLTGILNTFTETCQGEIMSRLIGISNRDYLALLRKDSPLRLYGILDEYFRIDADFIDCVESSSMQPFFIDLLKESDSGSSYDLETFNVPENTKNLMSQMLKSDEGLSLLLYGKPGSGKTEFAKSLAKESGLKAYVFKNESELVKDKNVLCRLNCLLSMNSDKCVYIIDEAESLLRTCDVFFFGMVRPSPNKGTVNKMLEENRNKIIWIVNFTSQMDDSTLRRFTYSYRFEFMSKSQLRNITESKLKSLSLPEKLNGEILDLMEMYKVTGASVENVIKAIKSLGGNKGNVDEESLITGIKSVLKENALLLNGKPRMRETVTENYDLSVLNASMNPDQIVQMVLNARDFAEKNGMAAEGASGVRMLFYGVSGSGKTEFARYIAGQLGSKILLKRASDILDKYVGESEQHIREAFEEAERTDSILLFDEADSFFSDRESARNSWERTLVNEFLTQMEEFSGILICTTNLKSIMDPALNRRFHIITEFKPLNEKGISTLLGKYFSGIEFAGEEVARLERMSSVTPGDFGALAGRIRFLSESERTPSYIIDELCKIQEEKQGGDTRRIGFGA